MEPAGSSNFDCTGAKHRALVAYLITYCKSNIAPGHGIPRLWLQHPLLAQRQACESKVANVTEPQRDEIAPDHLDLGSCRKDCQPDKAHEKIHVAQLLRHDQTVLRCRKHLLLGQLLGDEPCWVPDGADEAGDSALGQGEISLPGGVYATRVLATWTPRAHSQRNRLNNGKRHPRNRR